MNTQQLRCFLMVADKLNFTKAAQALYFSVPTVTHHIQNLESELGTQLFVRGKKGVRLTEAGRNFYPSAADILSRLDTALENMKVKTEKAVLSLGCTSHAEMVMLTSVFTQYRKQYPQIIPHVEIDNYDLILDMFDEKQLDLILTTDNMISRRSREYPFRKLCTVVGYAVTDQHAPIASHQTVSFDEIEDATLIGLHDAFVPGATPNKVTQRMSLHHLKHKDILCADDRMALSLCKAGYGIAVLPAYCIPEYYRELGLAITPIIESQKIVYGLITQDNSPNGHILSFIHLIEKKLKQNIL